MEEIGNLHNQYLNNMISSINFSNINSLDLYQYSKSLCINVNCNLILQDKKYIANTFSKKYIDDLKEYISTDVYNFAQNVENEVYSNSTHDELVEKLNLIENNARSQLKGSNLDQILVMISVAKNSSYFWTPSDLGGSGIGDNFNTLLSNSMGRVRHVSDDILMADCIAALEGMSLWALGSLLLTGPQSVVAYVVSVGLASAYGSLKFYLTEYNPRR